MGRSSLPPPSASTPPQSIAVGDFNADGKLDLGLSLNRVYNFAYGSLSLGGTRVLLGNGAGSFIAVGSTTLDYGYLSDLVVEDFDGGGRDDMAVANSDTGAVQVQIANPDGSLSAPQYTEYGNPTYLTMAGGTSMVTASSIW